MNASPEDLRRAGVPTIDPRYSFVRCAKCGHEYQIIDWGSAAHRLTCDPDREGVKVPDATSAEVTWAITQIQPGQGGIACPIMPGYDGPRAIVVSFPVASALIFRRAGVDSRIVGVTKP